MLNPRKKITIDKMFKGISPDTLHTFDYSAYKEQQYDLLADAVRKNLDMDMIYRIVKEGASYAH